MKSSRDNQTCELQKRISLGWVAYGKFRKIFKSKLPICLKRKYLISASCRANIRSKNSDTKSLATKLKVTQHRRERLILGVILSMRDRMRNEDLR